ncbi:MAG: YCF48-related protein [Ignavibacteriaceae bacterium]|nr:YCF48-related protein [Ignavibacteriaceae bacterium]
MKTLFPFITFLILTVTIHTQMFPPVWQNPLPTGADHNDLVMFSASNFLLAGNGGAITRTTNGGTGWIVTNADTLERNITAVSFPSSLIGYACGSEGMILKTTDGGATWSEQASGVTGSLWGINFVNNDTGYIAGASGTILKTMDGGATWVSINYGTVTHYLITFISPSTGFLGSTSATTGRLVKTTDAGTTWSDISSLLAGNSGAVRSITFKDALTGLVSTASGLIYRTSDGGTTWTQVFTIGSTTTIIYKTAFADGGFAFASTTTGRIIRSTDDGVTWSIVQTDSRKSLYSLGASGNRVIAAGDAGTILTSTDNGQTFQPLMNAASQEQLQRISFPTAQTGYAVGGSIASGNTFGNLLKTTDGGMTWNKLSFSTTTRIYSVCFLNEQTGYIGSEGPTGLYKTTDGGLNWTALNTGTGVATSIIYDIDFLDANTGFAAYASGQIAKTTDGGSTWSALPAGFGSAACYDIYIASPSVIFALGPGGRISKSVDGGSTFAQMPTLGTTTLYSMHFFNPDTGFVVGSSGKIWKTTNGTNFTEITSPVATTIYVVRFVNRQLGWFGASGGDIYFTLDGGETWNRYPALLGSSQSTRDIQFAEGKMWIAGTDGMILKTNADPTIPVELTSFTAHYTGGTVTLTWVTATETNNAGFEIERSIQSPENGSWHSAGFVPGAGTSTERNIYTFTDQPESDGSVYYRLKQKDLDGSYTYSQVIMINTGAVESFSLGQNYPNPFNPVTMIEFALAAQSEITLKIYDILGKEIATLASGNYQAGRYTIPFDGTNYASGVYIYKLSYGKGQTITKKMTLLK